MNFLNMKFSTLFVEKHGEKVFNDIRGQIELENSDKSSSDYVEIVFKLALLDFWGLKEDQIKKIFEDIMPDQKINIEKIQSIHKNSINKIQKYLQVELDS